MAVMDWIKRLRGTKGKEHAKVIEQILHAYDTGRITRQEAESAIRADTGINVTTDQSALMAQAYMADKIQEDLFRQAMANAVKSGTATLQRAVLTSSNARWFDLRDWLIKHGIDCPHQLEVYEDQASPCWKVIHHNKEKSTLTLDHLFIESNERGLYSYIAGWLERVHQEAEHPIDLDVYDNLEPEQWV